MEWYHYALGILIGLVLWVILARLGVIKWIRRKFSKKEGTDSEKKSAKVTEGKLLYISEIVSEQRETQPIVPKAEASDVPSVYQSLAAGSAV